MAQCEAAYTSRRLKSRRARGTTRPANGGRLSRSSTPRCSASSQARPAATYTGWTIRVWASCAASTALSSPPDSKTSELCRDSAVGIWDSRDDMYSVTKRIEFCYGHRLLDYDGICKHPHGHNAVAE